MFFIRSEPTQTPANPLTDIAPTPEEIETAERRARHKRVLQRLTELALQLAEAAAARTLTQWSDEDEEENAALPPSKRRRRRARDPILTFTRLSNEARQAVALETRIAEGPKPQRAKAERPQPPAPDPKLLADKRRGPAREALVMLTKKHPDRANIIKIAHDRLDQELLADTETEIAELLQKFCSDIGIVCDLGRLPDHVLGIDPSTWPPPPPPKPFLWPGNLPTTGPPPDNPP